MLLEAQDPNWWEWVDYERADGPGTRHNPGRTHASGSGEGPNIRLT